MNRFSGRGIVSSVTLLFVGIANALFGGFGVAVTLPNLNDPKQKDAVLAVQPVGCHGPGASVIARAEGIVNGSRKTIALHPINLNPQRCAPEGQVRQGDTFILKREWPAEGTWVLSITARKTYEGDGKTQVMDAHVVVPIDASGRVLLVDRPRERSWNEAQTLPDGKTKLLLYPFGDGNRVPATYIVWGDLKAAVAYKLHSLQ